MRNSNRKPHIEVANSAMSSSAGRSRCCAASSSRAGGQAAEVQWQPGKHAEVLIEVIAQAGIKLNELVGRIYSSLQSLNFSNASFRFRRLGNLTLNREGGDGYCEQDKELAEFHCLLLYRLCKRYFCVRR